MPSFIVLELPLIVQVSVKGAPITIFIQLVLPGWVLSMWVDNENIYDAQCKKRDLTKKKKKRKKIILHGLAVWSGSLCVLQCTLLIDSVLKQTAKVWADWADAVNNVS